MAVARVTEIVASSNKSWQDAAEAGFKRASKTLRGITGLHVLARIIHVFDFFCRHEKPPVLQTCCEDSVCKQPRRLSLD